MGPPENDRKGDSERAISRGALENHMLNAKSCFGAAPLTLTSNGAAGKPAYSEYHWT